MSTLESGARFSPYGKSINKTLLTPCRRVGLSKKKTPDKGLSQDLTCANILVNQSVNITPKSVNITPNNKKSSLKRKLKVSSVKQSLKVAELKSPTKIKKNLNNTNNSDKYCDAIQEECVSVDLSKKQNDETCIPIERIKSDISEVSHSFRECKVNLIKYDVTDLQENVDKSLSDEEEFIIRRKKRRGIQLNDDDEDILSVKDYSERNLLSNEETEHESLETKTHTSQLNDDDDDVFFGYDTAALSESVKDYSERDRFPKDETERDSLESKRYTKTNSNSALSSLINMHEDDYYDFTSTPDTDVEKEIQTDSVSENKECKTALNKFETIEQNNLKRKVKNKTILKSKLSGLALVADIEEDDVAFTSTPTTDKTVKKDFIKKTKCSKSSTRSEEKSEEDLSDNIKNSKSQLPLDKTQQNKLVQKFQIKSNSKNKFYGLASVANVVEDDDEAFTSSPDTEIDKKNELMDKIKSVESEIKRNKLELENLKRAYVYKSKHNVDELKKLTETWRQGCYLGLSELLTKLQQQGPLDMQELLKKLHIPDDMIAKIFINMNC